MEGIPPASASKGCIQFFSLFNKKPQRPYKRNTLIKPKDASKIVNNKVLQAGDRRSKQKNGIPKRNTE
jgi:hypothetical protein